jgi:hypothetical protein
VGAEGAIITSSYVVIYDKAIKNKVINLLGFRSIYFIKEIFSDHSLSNYHSSTFSYPGRFGCSGLTYNSWDSYFFSTIYLPWINVPSLLVTLWKYWGFRTPSYPSVRITLFVLMKNYMPSFMAAAKSISMMTSQLPLIPEITPSSLGMPGAKWIWFLVILFKPPSLMSPQNLENVPWTTVGYSEGSVIFVSSSSVLMIFMECPCVALMNLWCFLSSISKRFLSLLSTMCLILSSSMFLHPFLLRKCMTSSRGTYPLG